MKLRNCLYTKVNGDRSKRRVVVVAEPRENYLVYDVSSLTEDELEMLTRYMNSIEDYREATMQEFSDITGIKQADLWRSFKPEGIEWVTENEV